MTIYIDDDFKCYTEDADGLRPVETDFFDGKVAAFIGGYHFVPEGETWTRDDGAIFAGQMICPHVDYNLLDAAQREDEREALEILGAIGEAPPSEMAREIREVFDVAVELLPEDAVTRIGAGRLEALAGRKGGGTLSEKKGG